MEVSVPEAEATEFAKTRATENYLRDERDYKGGEHQVVACLLSADVLDRDDFPELLAEVLSGKPNLEELQLDGTALAEAFAHSGVNGPQQAIANLSGGRWGLAQFIWIPRAVEYGLGAPIHRRSGHWSPTRHFATEWKPT